MPTYYGYARCSTNEKLQDIDRQKRELLKLGVADEKYIYWEYESGTNDKRPEFNKLLDIVGEGDTIVSTEVSRLTRSTKLLCDILKIVQERKLQLIIGAFVVDCRSDEIDPMTKGMLMMWGVFSEMERDIISQRVKSGLDNAVAKGKKLGRPVVTRETLPAKFWEFYPLYNKKKINVSDMSRLMQCSRATVYNYIHLAEDKK